MNIISCLDPVLLNYINIPGWIDKTFIESTSGYLIPRFPLPQIKIYSSEYLNWLLCWRSASITPKLFLQLTSSIKTIVQQTKINTTVSRPQQNRPVIEKDQIKPTAASPTWKIHSQRTKPKEKCLSLNWAWKSLKKKTITQHSPQKLANPSNGWNSENPIRIQPPVPLCSHVLSLIAIGTRARAYKRARGGEKGYILYLRAAMFAV